MNATFVSPTSGGANLAGANLSRANLTNVIFTNSTLAGADLSEANLTGARLGHHEFTYGGANLTGANLRQANLTNASFAGLLVYDEWGGESIYPGADLTNANLSGADARGANFTYATLDGANTNNLIQSNGHIDGLELSAESAFIVRDYDDGIAVIVDQHLMMDTTSTMRLVFDADAWGSTISFAPGIPVTLGGALEMTFGPDVNLATQVGRTIDLFDWTGVSPTGVFTVSSPYTWDLSELYTTGEVTLSAMSDASGDFDADGDVDGRDFLAWQRDPAVGDLADWQNNYGGGTNVASNVAVPEPCSILLLTGVGLVLMKSRIVRGNIRVRVRQSGKSPYLDKVQIPNI